MLGVNDKIASRSHGSVRDVMTTMRTDFEYLRANQGIELLTKLLFEDHKIALSASLAPSGNDVKMPLVQPVSTILLFLVTSDSSNAEYLVMSGRLLGCIDVISWVVEEAGDAETHQASRSILASALPLLCTVRICLELVYDAPSCAGDVRNVVSSYLEASCFDKRCELDWVHNAVCLLVVLTTNGIPQGSLSAKKGPAPAAKPAEGATPGKRDPSKERSAEPANEAEAEPSEKDTVASECASATRCERTPPGTPREPTVPKTPETKAADMTPAGCKSPINTPPRSGYDDKAQSPLPQSRHSGDGVALLIDLCISLLSDLVLPPSTSRPRSRTPTSGTSEDLPASVACLFPTSDAPPVAPSNEVASTTFAALRLLNVVARGHLDVLQKMVKTDFSMEFLHIATILMRVCCEHANLLMELFGGSGERTAVDILPTGGAMRQTCHLRSVLHELLLLMGYVSLANRANQELFRWGKTPLLTLLCNLPVEYFSSVHKRILFPTLILLTFNDKENRKLLENEINISTVAEFIAAEQSEMKDSKTPRDISSIDDPENPVAVMQAMLGPKYTKLSPSALYSFHKRFPAPQWDTALQFYAEADE
eukprot:gene12407-19187_t